MYVLRQEGRWIFASHFLSLESGISCSERNPRIFEASTSTSSSSMLHGDMGEKGGQGDPAELMPITSSESNENEASNGSNNKEAKHYPPEDFSKKPIVVEAERNEYYPIAQPLYSTWICSQQTSHNPVNFLSKRLTITHAGSARDIPQGVPVNSLPTRLTITHVGSARDIPKSVLVNSLPTRSTVMHSGSAKDIPQAVPINPLPTRRRVTQADSARDIPEGAPVPVRIIRDVRVVSELQQPLLHNNIGNESDPFNSDHSMDALEVKPSIHLLNSNNGKASASLSRVMKSDQNEIFDGETYHVQVAKEASHLSSHGEGEPLNKFMSTKSLILAQNHTSTTPESNEDVSNISQPPTVTVAVPGFRSRQGGTSKSSISNRLRRARITERFKSLRELLPHSEEGNREDLMDDIIDYIKYLQLQIKMLSQSTLGGEATDDPFINLEGFGHYLLDKEMLSEPLEEVIGRLMEVNTPAFTQLLESRGLSVMPMALAGGLFQAM